jgi:hypothetical protein
LGDCSRGGKFIGEERRKRKQLRQRQRRGGTEFAERKE